jgi:hypothetical protein
MVGSLAEHFGFMQGPGVVFTKIHNDVDLNLVGMSGRYLGGTLGFSCHGMKFYNILHTGKFNTTGGTYTTAGGLVGEFMSSASYSCTATAAQKPIIVNNFILNPDSGSATAYFSTGVVGSNTSGASFSYADVKWNTTNGAPATCGGVCGTANRSSALTNAQMQTAATFDTTYWPVATWQFVDTVAPKLLNGY